MSQPRLKKFDEYETEDYKVIILVDTATNGAEYAEARLTPKKKVSDGQTRSDQASTSSKDADLQ